MAPTSPFAVRSAETLAAIKEEVYVRPVDNFDSPLSESRKKNCCIYSQFICNLFVNLFIPKTAKSVFVMSGQVFQRVCCPCSRNSIFQLGASNSKCFFAMTAYWPKAWTVLLCRIEEIIMQ